MKTLTKITAVLWVCYWGCLGFYVPANAALIGLWLCLAAYIIMNVRQSAEGHVISLKQVAASTWLFVGLWLLLCIIALLPDIGTANSRSIIRAWFLVPPACFIAFRLLGWKGLRYIVIGICLGLAIAALVYLLQKVAPGLDIRPYRYTLHNRFSLFFQHPADMSALVSWCLIVFTYCRLHGKIILHKKGDWLLPPLLLLLLTLGYARGPQLVTIIVIALMLVCRYRPSLRKMLIASLSVVAIVVLLYNVPQSYKHPFYRFTELVHNPLGGSISSRMPIWQAAVYGIKKKPLLGHGVHGFYEQHQEYISANYDELCKKYPYVETKVGTIHNLPLAVAHDAGLVGLGVFALMALIIVARSARKPAPVTLGAFGVAFCLLCGITETGIHEPWFIAVFFGCGTLFLTASKK